MLAAIIKDKIKNIDEFIYIKHRDDKFIYYGYSISNYGIKDLNMDVISNLYNHLKVNEDCKYLTTEKGYKVYYDEHNNLKHYIKNGIEDFRMFFYNNGVDVSLYKGEDRLPTRSEAKKIEIKNKAGNVVLSIIVSFVMCCLITTWGITAPYMSNEIIYAASDSFGFDLESCDINKAKEFINSSPYIDNDIKEFLANDSLLNDVFANYNDKMKYIVNARLKDINIKNFNNIFEPNVNGKYNLIELNTIRTANSLEYKSDEWYDVLGHEFVHLLQSYDTDLIYLTEASAELISSEYFGLKMDAYYDAVLNLKLLIDTIGPESIWKLVFTGDEEDFKNILQVNLSENEYNTLYEYFKISPADIKDEQIHIEIRALINKCYKNMYGIDMKDDYSIYSHDKYYIHKTAYFNEDKMKTQTISTPIYRVCDAGVIDYKKGYWYQKEVSKEEYYKILNDKTLDINKESFTIDYKIVTDKKFNIDDTDVLIQGAICYKDNIILQTTNGEYNISTADAIKLGYVTDVSYYYLYKTTDPNDLKIKDMKKSVELYEVIEAGETKTYTRSQLYKINVKSIKEKFPDQHIKKGGVEKSIINKLK